MKPYDVLCGGLLVADLFTSPMKTMLKPGELSLVEDIALECGGCSANVAVNLAKLGLRTVVSGKVGNDFFGKAVIDELDSRGLSASSIRISDTAPTSKTVIVNVQGEDRRYIHATGANAEFTAYDIDSKLITESKVLYVGGYLAMNQLKGDQLASVFRSAREAGTLTILDVVVPAGTAVDLEGLSKLLPYTDVFLPNVDEAEAISSIKDPELQLQYFQRMGAGCVVITRGGEGCIVQKEDQVVRAGVYPIELVDASGGGDAFTSGFIYGVLKGWELPRTIELASAMGASACRMRGCTTGTFTLEQAEEFMMSNRLIMEIN